MPIKPERLAVQTDYQLLILTITVQIIFVGSNPEYDFTFLQQVERGPFIGLIRLVDFRCNGADYRVTECSDTQPLAHIDQNL